jgi:hypothetical protein
MRLEDDGESVEYNQQISSMHAAKRSNAGKDESINVLKAS